MNNNKTIKIRWEFSKIKCGLDISVRHKDQVKSLLLIVLYLFRTKIINKTAKIEIDY